MIASINQTFLSRDPRFSLAAVFHSGQEALEWLRKRPVELLLLDVYMPRMSGLELLRELRAEEITLDVIMVTAANDSKTVDALLKLGVADYLVKPFTARRFQQALDTFCRQREAISAHTSVSQEDLDAMLSSGRSAAPVPKGLQLRTLARVRECLAQAPWRAAPARLCPSRWGSPLSPCAATSPTWWGGERPPAASIMTPAAAPPSSTACPRPRGLKFPMLLKRPPRIQRGGRFPLSPPHRHRKFAGGGMLRRGAPGQPEGRPRQPEFLGRFLQIPSPPLKIPHIFSQSRNFSKSALAFPGWFRYNVFIKRTSVYHR